MATTENKFVDIQVLNYAVTNLSTAITNNFSQKGHTVKDIEFVEAVPTNKIGITEDKEMCMKITYDDNGAVKKDGTIVDHVIYISVLQSAQGTGFESVFEQLGGTMTTVGGLSAGSIVTGQTAKQVLETILFPYIPPTVSLSISPSTSLYEVGDTVNQITMTAVVGKKSSPITAVEFYVGSTLVHIINSDSIKNGGTFQYDYTTPMTTNTTFKVVVKDGTKDVSATKSIAFTYKTYWGALSDITDITEPNIINQNGKLVNNKSTTVSFTTYNQFMFYAIPQSFGSINKIVDTFTNYELNDWKNIMLVIDGVKYTVYYSGNGQVTDYKLQFS